MIAFSNAKINIGLQVKYKREDGFHELETLFYPIPLSDVIEIVPSQNFSIDQSGPYAVNCPIEENLVYKAYEIIARQYAIKPSRIILHKNIPSGAGLGGGSSNAAFTLSMLNQINELNITEEELQKLAAKIGSDCAFFISNQPSLATGRGEILQKTSFTLKNKYLYLIIPDIHVSTAEAYGGILPVEPKNQLSDILKNPASWKELLQNDFEKHIFKLHPALNTIKEKLYELGAFYAAMSGSGSSMFGLFENEPEKLNLKGLRLEKIYKLEI
jgi:4-diphosphocytidyl-2-C-methyl-D-erythritol kinase